MAKGKREIFEIVDNVYELLSYSSQRYPSTVALIFGSKKISYSQLKKNVDTVASFLINLGIKKGEKVCLWVHNCPEFVYFYFAILKIGAVVVPINVMFKQEEAKFIVDNSSGKVLVVSIDKLDEALNINLRVDTLKHIIVLSKKVNLEGVISLDEVMNTSIKEIPVKVKRHDIAAILYTSGTTGFPKGAMLSHYNLISNTRDSCRAITVSRRDCFICILPLFHSFASLVCMILPLSRGAKIVIMRSLKPFKRVIRAIFKHRVTIFVGVPPLYNVLSNIKLPWFLPPFLLRLINPVRLCISGAAPLSVEVLQNFEKKFRIPLLEGYGLTEASPVVSLNPLKGKRKPGSVGLPYPTIQAKIVDSEGRELPAGKEGELIIKGPNVMVGYFNLPKETRETLRNGWLHTGDLAKIDEEGYIYIIGRIKDMILVRGFNVYPREIEEVLYKHSDVKEAAVVGVPHPSKGEVPVGFVVLKENASVSQRALILYLRERLASYKVPVRIIIKDSLPKNPTGKILKRQLREEVKDLFSSK